MTLSFVTSGFVFNSFLKAVFRLLIVIQEGDAANDWRRLMLLLLQTHQLWQVPCEYGLASYMAWALRLAKN